MTKAKTRQTPDSPAAESAPTPPDTTTEPAREQSGATDTAVGDTGSPGEQAEPAQGDLAPGDEHPDTAPGSPGEADQIPADEAALEDTSDHAEPNPYTGADVRQEV